MYSKLTIAALIPIYKSQNITMQISCFQIQNDNMSTIINFTIKRRQTVINQATIKMLACLINKCKQVIVSHSSFTQYPFLFVADLFLVRLYFCAWHLHPPPMLPVSHSHFLDIPAGFCRVITTARTAFSWLWILAITWQQIRHKWCESKWLHGSFPVFKV